MEQKIWKLLILLMHRFSVHSTTWKHVPSYRKNVCKMQTLHFPETSPSLYIHKEGRSKIHLILAMQSERHKCNFIFPLGIRKRVPWHFLSIFCISSSQIHLPSSPLVFHSPLLSQWTYKLPDTWRVFMSQFALTRTGCVSFAGAAVRGRDIKLLLSDSSGQTL